ncbi:MAG: hypothetical protein HFG80_04095 [Eubacterium sp.]|nr:hypothetical protein [Eubacterium sp.]
MEEWALCAVLGIGSIQDIKKRQVGWPVILAGLAGAFVFWFRGPAGAGAEEFFLGLIPGAGLAGLAVFSRQAVGFGDALMVAVMGLYTGIRQVWAELMTAGILALAAALILLVIFKKGKKYELPFLPFLLAAHLIMLCI